MKYYFNVLFCSLFLLLYQSVQAQPGWNILNSNTTINLKSVHFPAYDTGFVSGNSGLVLRTTNSGNDWEFLTTQISNDLNDIFFFNSLEGLAIGDAGSIIRTTDGGITWTPVTSGVADDLLSVNFSSDFGICGALSQTILISSDRGISWEIAQSGFVGGGFWGAVLLSPQIGFLGGENSIFQPLVGKTTDGGVNWDFTAFYLNNNEGRLTGIEFTDVFIGYASARVWDGRGAVSKTTDGGNNWNTTFFNNVLNSIDFPISNASLIGYTVGDLGKIYKTYNTGTLWLEQISGTLERLNKVYFLDLDNGYVVGDNGIILKTTTGGEPATNIGENESGMGEQFTFKLYQNYPNPFNPTTNIRFRISEVGFVLLKVYDILGNEIVTLVNQELTPGEYEVEFKPTANTRQLASGIYYYQLRAGSFVETRKMILAK